MFIYFINTYISLFITYFKTCRLYYRIRERGDIMYILFEMSSANGGTSIMNFDAMGFTKDEKLAIAWVQQNPNYRIYKYCPDRKVV